jgi:hypothetical protein
LAESAKLAAFLYPAQRLPENLNAWLATQSTSRRSPLKFPANRNFTGKITISGGKDDNRTAETTVPQGLFSEFPKQTIREIFSEEQGILSG